MADYRGKISGFYGYPRGQSGPERPFGMANFSEERCPTELPYWAPSGWRLTALIPPEYVPERIDPYILYDQWGKILHVWNQEYPPSYVDVLQVCDQLLKHS
jgi:hypothetical protein